MKTVHYCDVCGKDFPTPEEALACEKRHEEEKVKREQLSKAKSDRAKEVDSLFKTFYDAYKSFYNDYGTYPLINGEFSKFSPLERIVFSML